ncbi:glycoside hydrolase family 32 protein [Chitinophaga oryziterrae]|uniref:Glycoside hydrolase family 32 protein n=1 Tax=Chitinophaga oryziterrae TaxID=1031224 RepID=A0A6N8JKL8_9BACT|nr:glycoside hydrolase family 32 protein [Chitinophaga oryziterrae]MVT44929.1 glycoside hydrolase family 32 protein [Chitinophaga oryziterrae]
MKKLFAIWLAILPVLLYAQDTSTPQWRPVYHFTPVKNWTNDPNGLIYINGIYHLYYQHNPFENKWGHMSWGHATSRDLLHWQHLPVAIPEKEGKDTTTWIFSGSAVLDATNTSGFGKNAIVAIYTADQPKQKKESQFIAYSNDGGLTYTNYAGNPVIDIQRPDFRDPSVIRVGDKWVMTVAVPDDRKVQFYGSADLKKWELLSEFSKQGDNRKIWECPSLTPIFVDGDSTKKKWLLMVSSGNPDAATGMQYFTGDFDGKTFKNDNPADVQLFVDYGTTFYAAIPYNNLPGHTQTMLGWLMPFETGTYPWRGQMSIPRDLMLKTTSSGIRLYQQPAAVLNASLDKLPAAKKVFKKNVTVSGELALKGINSNSYWIDATFTPGTASSFGFVVAGEKIGYDIASKNLYISTRVSSTKVNRKDTGAVSGEKIRIQVLFDKSSLEVFVNGGEMVYTTLLFPGKDDTGISIYADRGNVKVDSLRIWDLGK